MAADAAQNYTGDWWSAGGAPLITLSTDQDMTREQMDAMRERWLELRALGSSVPAILARGVKAETFGADLGTAQADSALESMGASIARYFGVPPAMVNVRSAYGSMTYSTTEAQGITFARYTLEPYAGAIGDALSDYLPGDYQVGRRISLDLSHLTRAEQGARYAAYESGVRAGWLTPDEVRKAEGYALLGSATIASGPPAESEPELEEVPA
jgi:HK97 family phage portal protein